VSLTEKICAFKNFNDQDSSSNKTLRAVKKFVTKTHEPRLVIQLDDRTCFMASLKC